jgi:hypothetical protein
MGSGSYDLTASLSLDPPMRAMSWNLELAMGAPIGTSGCCDSYSSVTSTMLTT